MGHRHCSNRYARRDAGRDELRLELRAMCAPASTPSADFVGNSVHVSTKNSVDTSILKRSVAIKVPRQDAYALSTEVYSFSALAWRTQQAKEFCSSLWAAVHQRSSMLAASMPGSRSASPASRRGHRATRSGAREVHCARVVASCACRSRARLCEPCSRGEAIALAQATCALTCLAVIGKAVSTCDRSDQ